MIKKYLLLVLFNAFVMAISAQPKGFTALPANNDFSVRLADAAKRTQTINSDFIQEKNLNVLSETITSKGTFKFKKTDKVRMEYTTPFSYLLVINGDKVMIKDSQKSNSFSSRSNKLFTVINNIVIDCVQGTALDNKDFTAKVFKNEKMYLLQLEPVKKELKEYFNHISLYLDIKDCSVLKIDMEEPTGDNTVINFINKKLNGTIPDADFTVN